MLNCAGPATGTSLVTDLHLDMELFSTALWVWPFSQFLIHWFIHLSKPSLSNLETGMLCDTVSNSLHKSRYMVSAAFLPSSNAVNPVLEGHQICQFLASCFFHQLKTTFPKRSVLRLPQCIVVYSEIIVAIFGKQSNVISAVYHPASETKACKPKLICNRYLIRSKHQEN